MVQRFEQINSRIIYASLLIIMGLAVVTQLTVEKRTSISAAFIIVLIALANIGYLYRRVKRSAT